ALRQWRWPRQGRLRRLSNSNSLLQFRYASPSQVGIGRVREPRDVRFERRDARRVLERSPRLRSLLHLPLIEFGADRSGQPKADIVFGVAVVGRKPKAAGEAEVLHIGVPGTAAKDAVTIRDIRSRSTIIW